MSIKAVTYWEVHCDREGCGARLETDYTAWGDQGSALEEASDADWDVEDDGSEAYCRDHGRPYCIGCGRHASDLVTDESGDHWCEGCLAEECAAKAAAEATS